MVVKKCFVFELCIFVTKKKGGLGKFTRCKSHILLLFLEDHN